MKLYNYIFFVFFMSILCISCSGFLADDRMAYYYQQQLEDNSPSSFTVDYNTEGGSKEAPTQKNLKEGEVFDVADYTGVKVGYTFIGWNDGKNIYKGGQTYTMPANNVNFIAEWEQDALPEGATIYTMFDVLKPNGEIDEAIFSKFPASVQDNVRKTLSNVAIKPVTADFQNKLIKIGIVDNYVPSISYINGTWDGSGTTYSKAGEGFKVTKPTSVDAWDIIYYMYKGVNPEYDINSRENTSTFGDGSETRMNRFMFYQFTGTSGMMGINASLNNMLVAVDTYTNLIFAFAYPSDHTDIMGNKNPSDWTGISGSFYERDPIGYVDADGKFTIESWYNKLLQDSQGFLQPNQIENTGKSPYAYSVMEAGEEATAYLENIKKRSGQMFETRDGSVFDSITVNVSSDGNTVTITKINETGAVEASFDTAISATEGTFKYGDTTFGITLSDDANIITLIEGNVEKILTRVIEKMYTLNITAKSLKNVGMKSHQWGSTGFFQFGWKEQKEAYINYAIRSSVYTESATMDVLTHKENGDIISDRVLPLPKIGDTTITLSSNNGIKTFSDLAKSYSVSNVSVGSYSIALDAIVTHYGNSALGYVELDKKETYTKTHNSFNDKVTFAYNYSKGGFVVSSKSNNYTALPNDFVLKLGESKDFTMRYGNMNEITYTLSFSE